MMCGKDSCSSTLSPCALGFAAGVVKGLWLLLAAWVASFFGMGMPMVEHLSMFYHGYEASFVGGLVGALYGFICGYIFGFIFAHVYNWCFCFKKSRHDKEA